MTLDDVRAAAQALAAQGTTPSGNTVLAHLGNGSKKTVLKYLRQLADAGEVFAPVRPEPVPPVPVPEPLTEADDDPVFHHPPPTPPPTAQRRQDPAAEAKAAFVDARTALVAAKLQVLGARDVLVDGFVRGQLDRDDDFLQEALAAVDAAKRHYDGCLEALTMASEYAQMQAEAQRKAAQAAWVAAHHAPVVTALRQAWATYEELKRRPVDRDTRSAFSTASFVLQHAKKAYNDALALAPIHAGGTHAEEE